MSAIPDVFPLAPADFANRLSEPEPRRLEVSRRYDLLVGLVLLCLIPRVWMATKVASLCPDGIFYIHSAQALEQGDLTNGLGSMRLNVYPPLLIGLNRLGLDWDVAGKYWGVLISSLLVLPLFGWVRRQFDDRVALIACLLYATHGELITWSPETIRDPTFWFLFTLSLYLLWRAITEVHWGFCLAAGLSVALAIFTRFEGLFLLIPLGLWSFWRWRALLRGRWQLLVGVLLCVLAAPVLAFVVNLLWLHYPTPWEAFRYDRFYTAKRWMLDLVTSSPAETTAAVVADGAPRMTFLRTTWVFVPTFVKGLTPAFTLLMFGGMWHWRRMWLRRDHQPLFCVSLVIVVSVWIHLSFARCSCPRYVIPIALMASPFVALELWSLTGWTARRFQQWTGSAQWRWAAVVPGLLVVGVGLGDVLGNNGTNRLGEVRLGEWLRREVGPSPSLLGVDDLTSVVGYYARGSSETFPVWTSDEAILTMLRSSRPDAILMRAWRWTSTTNGQTLLERVESQGYQCVDRQRLPQECHEVLLVVRNDKAAQIAERAAGVSVGRKSRPHPL
jgi:hypothetical protein